MFRCPNPNCRQAYKMPVGDYVIYNNREMNNPIISVNARSNSMFNVLAKSQEVYASKEMNKMNEQLKPEYYKAIMNIYASNEPVCCPDCGEEHSMQDWMDCFKDPQSYDFESTELCFCGEEMMLDRMRNGRYGLYCDTCEEFSKQHQTYSSSMDSMLA